MTWPLAFALTLGLESIVLLALFLPQRRAWRILLAAVVANGVTHPIVWFVMTRLVLRYGSIPSFDAYGTYVILAELFAFGVEIPILVALLRPDPWYRAVTASALVNGTSYVAGLALMALLG